MEREEQPELQTLLTLEQSAQVLQVSLRTIWKLISTGELPKPLRIGHSRRFRRADLENYIETLTAAR